ncbi:MAG: hypothetical protein ABW321_05935 [Polyangiales bacterium]
MLRIERLDRVPLVRISADASSAFSDAELERVLTRLQEEMEADHKLQRRLVSIIDLRGSFPLTAKQRSKLAAWLKQKEQLSHEVSLGMAFVITSAVIRGVLTAVFWVQNPPVPCTVEGDLDAAVRWAIDRFDVEHVDVPASLRTDLGKVFEGSA